MSVVEYTFNEIVNAMTNHERNLWARAGYPGLRYAEVEDLLPFARAAVRRLEIRDAGPRPPADKTVAES